MKSKIAVIVILTMSLSLVGCKHNAHRAKDVILSEKDLIPEGTAYNSSADILYISCIYKQKIIGIDQEGNVSDIISAKHFGPFSPIGIEFDNTRQKLWACAAVAPIVNQSGNDEWTTTIMSFDTDNQLPIKQYTMLAGGDPVFFNDLTVDKNGNVYVTESVNNWIYIIDSDTDSLRKFVELKGFTFPNGITKEKDSDFIFIAVDQGILRLNPKNKAIQLLKASENVDATVIDGLAMHDNFFIGHQSTKVVKFYFNEDKTRLTSSEVLDSGDEFDSSTTGEVDNDEYYFIVNSQIRSGIDSDNKKIKPLDSLEDIIIRKIKL